MKVWIAAGLGLALGSCKFDPPVDKQPIDGPPTARLTVTLIGGGPGRVTGGGVDCATGNVGTCAVDVPVGQRVTLTYAADTVGGGSQVVVDGWGGDCASRGTAATCEVVADVERVVTHGARLQHQVAVTLVATDGGQGTVTSTPAGLACASGTCNAFFDAGAEVTLTANPATPNDRVSTVTGDCSTMPCTLPALGGPRATTVTFLRSTCVPSTQTCTLGRFTQCDAEGNYVSYLVPNGAPDGTATTLVMNDYLCPLGCHATEPRCNDVDATNGLNAALDHPAVSPSGVDLVLPRLGNNTAGDVSVSALAPGASELVVTDTDGVELRVPAMRVSQGAGVPSITVMLLRSFSFRAGSRLKFQPGFVDAFAIVTHFDTTLRGVIYLSEGGPGRLTTGCVGSFATLSTCTGGGATRVGSGGPCSASSGLDGIGGFMLNVPTDVLVGGCDPVESTSGGGGAIQLISRTRVAAFAGSLIDASGSNPRVCAFVLGGGGGGSVVIQAPSLALAPGAVFAARGGSGAASASSGGAACAPGNWGTTSGNDPARGATCAGCGVGGDGGFESSQNGKAGTGALPAVGGGGGAVGYCETWLGTTTFTPPPGSMKLVHLHRRVNTR
jgi:hypothetical protein